MPNSSRGSGFKGKKKLFKKGLALELSEDPTSIFFSALRHSHPEALAALASYCQRQTLAAHEEAAPRAEHDREGVLSAMDKLKIDGTKSSSKLKAIIKDMTLAAADFESRVAESELVCDIVVPIAEKLMTDEPEVGDVSEDEPDDDSDDGPEPVAEPEPIPELKQSKIEPVAEFSQETESEAEEEAVVEAEAEAETGIESDSGPDAVEKEGFSPQEETIPEQDSVPSKKRAIAKKPMRISPSQNKNATTVKGIPNISSDAIESIPGAFDKGIQQEFKGVYEKATQRGSVFDAKNRDAFSSESEKKVRSSYIGLKAISFDEALTAQSEKDPSLMRAQSQNDEPPEASLGHSEVLLNLAGKLFSTPVLVTSTIVFFGCMGLFVFNLYRAENYLRQGEELFADKKFSEAINVLTTASNLNPMRARILFFRGRANNKIGESGKAIADFTSSLKINPHNEEVLDHRATSYIRAGKFDKALADYRQIFRHHPHGNSLYRLNNAALAARQCGKFDESVEYCNKVLAIAPADPPALIGKALCEIGLGRYGKAVAMCDQIIEKNPNLADGYIHRGWCYMYLNRDEAAFKDFNSVLLKNPKDARALLNRGLLYYRRGNLNESIKNYDAAVEADPHFLDARIARSWAVLNSDPKKALADFKLIADSSQFGSYTKFWKARADLEDKLGDNQQAARTYKRAIKLALASDPSMLPILYVRLGRVLTELRKYDDVIEACDQALRLDPKNAMALALRGNAQDQNSNNISAIADYSAALAISPSLSDAHWFRAQHYLKTKEFHSAENDLRDYLRANPADKQAQRTLALVSSKTSHLRSEMDGASTRRANKYLAVPFDELVSKGLIELNAGKTETAAAMLTEAVRKNPADSTARRYLCHALVREDPKAAVVQFDVLRTAITLPPDDERSYRHALSLAATGTLVESKAIDNALKVVAADPYDGQACYKLSKLYAAAGMLSKAAQYCQSGLSGAKDPAETKKFQDLYQRLNKEHLEGERKIDIEG